MRFSSKEEWDQAGYAMQIAVQSLMSMDPRGRTAEIDAAISALQKSIDCLDKLEVFSDNFDPVLATY